MSKDQNSGGVMRRWTTSLWVTAILCVLFCGCGFINDHIFITYHAQEDVNRIEEAGNVAIKVKVFDLRYEASDMQAKSKVGIKGYASIIADNDLMELIARAIETELTNRGFKSGERVLIEVGLFKFYSFMSHSHFSNSAELIFRIDVKKMDGTLVYSNVVRGEGVNREFFIFYQGKYAKVALDRALKDGISKLVNDPEFIASLIKASVN